MLRGYSDLDTDIMMGRTSVWPLSQSFTGGIAQLGEHLVCNQKVSGSIPLTSTRIVINDRFLYGLFFLRATLFDIRSKVQKVRR